MIDIDNIRIGDRVLHRLYGAGVVLDMLPISGDIILTIEFDSGKKKKLCALVSKLEPEIQVNEQGKE
ncbi:MAG: hypothetical protein IKQ90_06225 [Ruminococcus sp.]|nr:hypothetical protein [Ruminococcus sp.]